MTVSTGRGRGRQLGSKNKATIEREMIAAQGVEVARSTGLMPLEVIRGVMNGDKSFTKLQYDAAVAAAPYMHARLSAVVHEVKNPLDGMSESALIELQRMISVELEKSAAVLTIDQDEDL